jgi:hypothetical protein
MATAKKGDKLSCEVCGLILTVDETFGIATLEKLVCCRKPMKKGAATAKRIKKKFKAAAAAPAAKKVVKKAAKKTVKKVAKKAAAKKPLKKAAPKKKASVKAKKK